MTSNVFVSHANGDKDTVARLCDELKLMGTDLWVSFRDLSPGTEWDTAIQDAMEAATHIIVAVSKASIDSSYVRAEVEYALNAGKAVIPVIIDAEARMPLRWRILQHVDWHDQSPAALVELATYLPKNGLMHFKEYLNDPACVDDLKMLLRNNPAWIHREARPTDRRSRVQSDFYYTTADTGGVYRYFCYLASPYEAPFAENGDPSGSIKQALKIAMQDTKPGADTQLLGQNVMDVVVYAGQRGQYSNTMYQQREKLQDRWIDHQIKRIKLMTAARVRLDLQIASYDRLLDKLQQRLETGHGG